MFLVSFFILRSGHDGRKKFAMEKFLCAVVTSMIIYVQNVHFTTSNENLRFCGQEF